MTRKPEKDVGKINSAKIKPKQIIRSLLFIREQGLWSYREIEELDSGSLKPVL